MEKVVLTYGAKKHPFFAFLFLDSVTFGLSFRETRRIYRLQTLLERSQPNQAFQTILTGLPYFNRYINSVFFTDKNSRDCALFHILGKNIDIDRPSSYITSDHGEEFNDTGKKKLLGDNNGQFYKISRAQIPFIC